MQRSSDTDSRGNVVEVDDGLLAVRRRGKAKTIRGKKHGVRKTLQHLQSTYDLLSSSDLSRLFDVRACRCCLLSWDSWMFVDGTASFLLLPCPCPFFLSFVLSSFVLTHALSLFSCPLFPPPLFLTGGEQAQASCAVHYQYQCHPSNVSGLRRHQGGRYIQPCACLCVCVSVCLCACLCSLTNSTTAPVLSTCFFASMCVRCRSSTTCACAWSCATSPWTSRCVCVYVCACVCRFPRAGNRRDSHESAFRWHRCATKAKLELEKRLPGSTVPQAFLEGLHLGVSCGFVVCVFRHICLPYLLWVRMSVCRGSLNRVRGDGNWAKESYLLFVCVHVCVCVHVRVCVCVCAVSREF